MEFKAGRFTGEARCASHATPGFRNPSRKKPERKVGRRWKITRRLGKWAESITFDGSCVLVLHVGNANNRAEDIVRALNAAGVTL